MPKIIGISGRKQSGKDSSAAYIASSLYCEFINTKYNNKLVVYQDNKQNIFIKDGEKQFITCNNQDIFQLINVHYAMCQDLPEKLVYGEASQKMFCEKISCATPIKQFMIETLGIDRELCYGTDAQKNAPTKYTWELVPQDIRQKYGKIKSDKMSSRDIMVYVGTHLFRQKFYDNTWAQGLINSIKNKMGNVQYVFVPDIRFPNQADTTLFNNGLVIRLNRIPFPGDASKPQTALDDYNWDKQNCKVIYNQNHIIQDKNKQLDLVIPWIINSK